MTDVKVYGNITTMEEKKERNLQLFLEKYGYLRLDLAKRKLASRPPMSFRALSIKYNLSITRLQKLIYRTKKQIEEDTFTLE